MRLETSIWVGFDQREAAAFAVARHSIQKHLTQQIPIRGIVLSDLQAKRLYTRPIEMRPSALDMPVMWDVISEAPMSTQHACARFLIKELAVRGWALFCDGDILARANVARLFEQLDHNVPLYCVKHNYEPKAGLKMDGMQNQAYPKKNWSSLFILNTEHKANQALTVEFVNSVPGRDLHRFSWLDEDKIGDLPPEWNYLIGESKPLPDVKIAHFTLGTPDMAGYADCEFANEWRAELARWAA